jgi:hypothetical protein
MNSPQGVRIGAAHRIQVDYLTGIAVDVYGPSLFAGHQQLVEELRQGSAPYIGDQSDKAIEWARAIAVFDHSQDARS